MLLLAALPSGVEAQRSSRGRDPHIGYVFPAGGRVGTTVEVTVGGQFLEGASDVRVSGTGVRGSIIKHNRPLTQREVNLLRDKIDKAKEQLEADGKKVDWRRRTGAYAELVALLEKQEVSQEDLDKLDDYYRKRADTKRQLNPQIEESVIVQLAVAGDASLGKREIRLRTPSGLSNPLWIQVDALRECRETEPDDGKVDKVIGAELPVIVNGQIMPGDVDRFQFTARRGMRLVASASARELIPYLADAVPGWFQATLALYDSSGKEIAFDDDFQFHPDPVLFCRIPKDDTYDLEIRDAIYRGREDFVYRIKLGRLPFITSIFPLGGQKDQPRQIALQGWNLPTDALELDDEVHELGVHHIGLQGRYGASNRVPFAVDTLPESVEAEPNNEPAAAQVLKPPLIVNGRIDEPGDMDIYRFEGRAGGKVILETQARRLNSPVDSQILLTDAAGQQIGFNDDTEDRGDGLTTHHADSRLLVTLPTDGTYFVHVSDTQKQGGPAYAYRLRISARRRDFDLRVVPSTINARPGSRVPLTVYALRKDGFEGDIRVALQDPPEGFVLSDGLIPADKENVELVLMLPQADDGTTVALTLEGQADIKGTRIMRPFVPADDMMQAFIYHHLVPSHDLTVTISKDARRWTIGGGQGSGTDQTRLRITAGGFVRHQLALPDTPDLEAVRVELKQPPDGITIRRVVNGLGGLVMLLAADKEQVKPGQQGYLQFNVYIEKTVPGHDGMPPTKRKEPIGKFPPVAYEVVGR